MNDYDYDKTLRNENKDIMNLRAQINALTGVTNDAGVAQLARLRAQLAEKEADHEETLRNHALEMQQEGYNKLSSDANDALDEALHAIEANADKQEEVVNMMLERLKGNYGSAYTEIENIISHTGTVISDTTNSSVDLINNAIETVVENAKVNIGGAFDTIADSITKAINTAVISVNSTSTKNAELTLSTTDTAATIDAAKKSTTPEKSPVATNLVGAVTAVKNVETAAAEAAKKKAAEEAAKKKAAAEAAKKKAAEEAAKKKAAAAAAAKKKTTTTAKTATTAKTTTTALNGVVSGIKSTLRKGSRGSDVSKLQTALNKLGYKDNSNRKLAVDGIMGDNTVAALKKFQKAMKVSQTGQLDTATKTAFKKKGYAKGTLGTLSNELNFTHEGEIIRRSDGAILRQLPQGTQVIPRAQSENLLKWADMTPDFLKNAIENIQPANMSMGVTNHYDSLITINGNVDENVMDRLEDLAKQLLNNRNFKNGTVQMISKEFGRELRKIGM